MIEADTSREKFSAEECENFHNDGYIIQRGLIPPAYVQTILDVTRRDTGAHFGDIEYEADVSYPGAPQSLDAEGGTDNSTAATGLQSRSRVFETGQRIVSAESTSAIAGASGCHAVSSSQLRDDQASGIQQRHRLASGHSVLVVC